MTPGGRGVRGKRGEGKPKELLPRFGFGPWGPQPPALLWPPQGFTAIHFAAQKGKLECLQVLVEEYKFPVDLPTKNGQTPLHLVIHKENKNVVLPCVHYLLQHGAALNT